eukprot:TRINITY_DN8030_c0_g1_i1.p1 TRINITY_DN8030_c0_g1~~TRINITY_DN8030_c0_g1_i1.p1  ORF type:complete len:483 (-),score=149.58 TRINITY_DN8030_c0_g1_i1:59-1507(-)
MNLMSKALTGVVVLILVCSIGIYFVQNNNNNEQVSKEAQKLRSSRKVDYSSSPKEGEFDITYKLGTKTIYHSSSELKKLSEQVETPSSCREIHYNLVARHGTRYPTANDEIKFNALSVKLNEYSDYISDEYSFLKNWENPWDKGNNAGQLVWRGQEEHYHLSQRLEDNYKTILGSQYSTESFILQSTQVPRASQSAQSFGFGLFQGDGILGGSEYEPFYLFSESNDVDTELRFFDNCPIYKTTVKKNDTAIEQSNIYKDTVIQEIADKFTVQIGVSDVWNITADEYILFYKICAFQIAIDNVKQQFCTLFDEYTANRLEYYNDLKTYYQKGYAYPVSYNMATNLLQEVVEVMEGVIDGTVKEKANLRFAHAETIIPFNCILGLFKDEEPLLANFTIEQQDNRAFKTSLFSPFAGNVGIILYECIENNVETYRVKATVNEIDIILPGCDEMYCKFDTFKSIYQEAVDLNFIDVCFDEEPICQH